MKTITNWQLRSVDAWRDQDGWYSNQEWIETTIKLVGRVSNRRLLAALREARYLTPESAGKLAVDDVGDFIEVVAKGTGEPIYYLHNLDWRTREEIAGEVYEHGCLCIIGGDEDA